MCPVLLLALLPCALGQSLRQALEEDCTGRDGNALLQRATSAKVQTSAEYQALVINLDTRKDRWEHMTEELEPLENAGFLTYERLQGVNGSTMEVSDDIFAPVHDYHPVIKELVQDWYGFDVSEPMTDMIMKFAERAPTWSDGERGCAMSHIKAWRTISEGTEPVLVFEDDAVLEPDFMKVLVESKRILESQPDSNPDILFLQYNTFRKMMNLPVPESTDGVTFRGQVADLGNRTLRKSDFVLDSGSYLLWPSGAQKLLASIPLNYTAGFIISLKVHRGEMEGFAINPPLVNQLWMTNASDPAAMNDIEKLTE